MRNIHIGFLLTLAAPMITHATEITSFTNVFTNAHQIFAVPYLFSGSDITVQASGVTGSLHCEVGSDVLFDGDVTDTYTLTDTIVNSGSTTFDCTSSLRAENSGEYGINLLYKGTKLLANDMTVTMTKCTADVQDVTFSNLNSNSSTTATLPVTMHGGVVSLTSNDLSLFGTLKVGGGNDVLIKASDGIRLCPLIT